MISFIHRFIYLFTSGEAVDECIRDKNRELEKKKQIDDQYRLKLCFKHRQEHNHSHYGSNNCDYCKLIEENKKLRDKCDVGVSR